MSISQQQTVPAVSRLDQGAPLAPEPPALQAGMPPFYKVAASTPCLLIPATQPTISINQPTHRPNDQPPTDTDRHQTRQQKMRCVTARQSTASSKLGAAGPESNKDSNGEQRGTYMLRPADASDRLTGGCGQASKSRGAHSSGVDPGVVLKRLR